MIKSSFTVIKSYEELIECVKEVILFEYLPPNARISTMTVPIKTTIEFNVKNIELYLPQNKYIKIAHKKPNSENKQNNQSGLNKKQISLKICEYIQQYPKDCSQEHIDKQIYAQKKGMFRNINVKIFTNGTVHITGCFNVYHLANCFKRILHELKPLYAIRVSKTKLVEVPFAKSHEQFSYESIESVYAKMINSDFVTIGQKDLHGLNKYINQKSQEWIKNHRIESLKKSKMVNKEDVQEGVPPFSCMFKDDISAHATIFFHYDFEKYSDKINYHLIKKSPVHIQIFVFYYEKIIITGSSNFHQLKTAYDFVNEILTNKALNLTLNNPFITVQTFINSHRRFGNVNNPFTESYKVKNKIATIDG